MDRRDLYVAGDWPKWRQLHEGRLYSARQPGLALPEALPQPPLPAPGRDPCRKQAGTCLRLRSVSSSARSRLRPPHASVRLGRPALAPHCWAVSAIACLRHRHGPTTRGLQKKSQRRTTYSSRPTVAASSTRRSPLAEGRSQTNGDAAGCGWWSVGSRSGRP